MSIKYNPEKKMGSDNVEGDPSIPYGPEQLPWKEQVPRDVDVTAPSDDPIKIYPQVPPPNVEGEFPKIDYKMFEIPPAGITEKQRNSALAMLKEFAETQSSRFTGYQVTQNQSYSPRLSWLLDMSTNNVGDPFQSGIFTLNTKFCERAVLDYFAALWHINWPHHDDTSAFDYPDRYWGYVLSMGSTEANVYALFNARDYLKGRSLIEDPGTEPPEKKYMSTDPLSDPENPNAYKPIVFYSQDTHYSVVKAVRILELTTFYQEGNIKFPGQCPITENGEWPQEVPSHDFDKVDGKDNPLSGTIKVYELNKLVRFFLAHGYSILIVLNVGSTWKSAHDDVEAVNEMLLKLGDEFPWLWERNVHYNPAKPELIDQRRGFWVHVDGALGAGYLPFLEMSHKRGLIGKGKKFPIFDFRNKAVMSICCSTHKWFGAPWPGAIYMTRNRFQLKSETPSYIGSADTTLGGSRNAFSAVILWDYLSRNSYEDSMNAVLKAEEVAAYLEQQLIQLEGDLKKQFPHQEVDLWISRSEYALAIRFRLVNVTISYKYTVDSERLWIPVSDDERQERTYSHVYVMPSVNKKLVDELIEDLRKASQDDWHNAFPAWDGDQPNPGYTKPISPPVRAVENTIMSIPHEGRGLGSFIHPSKRG